jgi:hypothetical protein
MISVLDADAQLLKPLLFLATATLDAPQRSARKRRDLALGQYCLH